MNKKDKIWWANFRDNIRGYITNDEYLKVSELHSLYFDHAINYPCKCNPKVIQSYIDDLNLIYDGSAK